MDRTEMRSATDEALDGRYAAIRADLKALGQRWRMDDHAGLDAAEARVAEAEAALAQLRAEADSLPAARARALDGLRAADIRKIGDRITDVRLDLRIAEALVCDAQARALEIRGGADGEIGQPGRRLTLEARDLLAEQERRLNLLAGPIQAAGNSAIASISAAAELRRKRAALLEEAEPVGARR